MRYQHTQRGPWHYVVVILGLAMLVAAWFVRGDPLGVTILTGLGLLMFPTAAAFAQLTVEDEGDELAVRFGPLPLFGKRIPYHRITDVAADRSSLIDGWGLHFIPGRGWTYNVWGFDCVRLCVEGKQIRVGTDDRENLLALLRSKTGHVG